MDGTQMRQAGDPRIRGNAAVPAFGLQLLSLPDDSRINWRTFNIPPTPLRSCLVMAASLVFLHNSSCHWILSKFYVVVIVVFLAGCSRSQIASVFVALLRKGFHRVASKFCPIDSPRCFLRIFSSRMQLTSQPLSDLEAVKSFAATEQARVANSGKAFQGCLEHFIKVERCSLLGNCT